MYIILINLVLGNGKCHVWSTYLCCKVNGVASGDAGNSDSNEEEENEGESEAAGNIDE